MKALCHFHVFAQSTFRGWQKIAPCVLSDIKAHGLVLLSHMAKHDPELDLIFQALSDPTRRAMLARLGQGVAAVSALAQPTGLALPTVMRHLSVLEAAGLIVTEKAGRARMCRAEPGALAPVADWLAAQRAHWDGGLDRLEIYVQTLIEKETRG